MRHSKKHWKLLYDYLMKNGVLAHIKYYDGDPPERWPFCFVFFRKGVSVTTSDSCWVFKDGPSTQSSFDMFLKQIKKAERFLSDPLPLMPVLYKHNLLHKKD